MKTVASLIQFVFILSLALVALVLSPIMERRASPPGTHASNHVPDVRARTSLT
jgi:hypothetical protein